MTCKKIVRPAKRGNSFIICRKGEEGSICRGKIRAIILDYNEHCGDCFNIFYKCEKCNYALKQSEIPEGFFSYWDTEEFRKAEETSINSRLETLS
jgi:hypothetical protein